ncbi:MAG: hypothetical protein GWP62_01255 [Gammaproteobacteria bacterium]|jgi:membrane-bound metal-dependent hydrolase YbcI (DUF457 family)|nr:hypothetical protein [Gammaproteobacteria bacterium]
MFIGHFALGFGAKKFAPQVSLGILFLACQMADIIWPNLVLLGLETLRIQPGITVMTPLDFVSYPYSHSLVALLLWSVVFGALYMVLSRVGIKVAIVIAALVLSHWVLDVLTHRPDLPITLSEGTKIGAGLWNYPVIAIPLELLLFGTGVFLYQRHTRALNRVGSIGLWALVLFLLTVYVANIFGPPPPSATAVAWSAQAMWLIIAWGFWIDRNRTSTGGDESYE